MRQHYVLESAIGSRRTRPRRFGQTGHCGLYRAAWLALTLSGLLDLGGSVASAQTVGSGQATIRYDASSATIYVSGGGLARLTDIQTAAPQAQLTLVDPVNRVWFLGANIIVQDGSTLLLHGSALAGGDVNELRLKSDSPASTNSSVRLDADWGTIDLQNVKVTSWDESTGAPDPTNGVYASQPRAFISAISRAAGTNFLQSTLNVLNCQIGWLGMGQGQGYGLTWDLTGSAPGAAVLGTVSNSYIHDSQLGVTGWSSGSVSWSANEIATNVLYGFDPTDPAQRAVVAANNVHDNAYGATFRWVASNQRIYVSGQGQATLSDIKAALPNARLCPLPTTNQTWFLSASLMVSGGATLLVHGTAVGGDTDELRLQSDNSSADGSSAVVEADWGTLDFQNVKVESWDQLGAGPDTEFANFGRAFIRARSRLLGTNAQQSTLNVLNSEIGWLGANSGDNFGLTWQVVGSAPGVSVFGVVSNDYIHDCQLSVADWFGQPAIYGSAVQWSGNTITNDTLFGFDPLNSSQKTVLAANNVYGTSFAPIIRWAATDQRIYVTGSGTATLSDILSAAGHMPLTLVDPTNMVWYLGANLYVIGGAHLELYGPAIGGDVAELRLKSNHPGSSNDIVELRADAGWLDIRNTRITSWNTALGGPDTITNIFTQPRSYIHARSTLDPDGRTAHESRLDVLNSDIGYLGYHATESYGLVWKVVDTTAKYIAPGSTNTLYDLVKVRGDILNSHLHHNCFGMYSYGHYGGHWATNEVDHNLAYGFDPHNYSDFLVIENNQVHDNGWHGIIASIGCRFGILRDNLSYNNGVDLSQARGNGIMLHRSSDSWLVENNQSYNNRDSGIALFAVDSTTVRNNLCSSNGNAAIRLSVGSKNNLVVSNQFIASGGNGIYVYQGSDPPEADDVGVNNGRCQNNTFLSNLVDGTGLLGTNVEAIKVDNCDSNAFVANVLVETNRVQVGTNIFGTNSLLHFEGTNSVVISNTLPRQTMLLLATTTTNFVTITNQVPVTNSIADFTTTTFAGPSSFSLQLQIHSAATFTNSDGAIFQSSNTNVYLTNFVSTTGSRAKLTQGQAGNGTSIVSAANFFAVPTLGRAQVALTTWTQVDPLQTAWTVQGSTTINYRLGDLVPGASYVVTAGTNTLTTLIADSNGYVSFASASGTVSNLTYTVSRQ